MPTAPVDDKGTVLYYEDSGAPAGLTTYTTLVILHGTLFNLGIFRPMLPFAEANKLRIVLLNQRDYSGSTLYTPSELAAIVSPEAETQADFIKGRIVELASFLYWFVRQEKIPELKDAEVGEGGKVGGVAFAFWSAGGFFGIPLLALAESIAPDPLKFLEGYLRSIVMLDTPYYPSEFPPLEDVYSPVHDTSLSPEKAASAFPPWNSSFYTHSPKMLESFTVSSYDDLPPRSDFIKGLAKEPDPQPICTIYRIPPEKMPEISNPEGLMRSQIPLSMINRTFFAGCAETVFFDKALNKRVWPNVRLEIVTYEKTVNYAIDATWELKRKYLEKRRGGPGGLGLDDGGRLVNFRVFKGFNHYPHWESPEEFTKQVAAIL